MKKNLIKILTRNNAEVVTRKGDKTMKRTFFKFTKNPRIGFTLAELTITLVVVGIIAAMTIPQMLGKTNKQEIITARNKALSVASNALMKDYALYGKNPDGTAAT